MQSAFYIKSMLVFLRVVLETYSLELRIVVCRSGVLPDPWFRGNRVWREEVLFGVFRQRR